MSAATLEARCPAKVNLSLIVGDRRDDGYHSVRTVFQSIDVWDTLTGSPAGGLALACDDPAVPANGSNLVIRAARALALRCGDPAAGASLRLRKRIPVGGGMGGGSSDAAGALLLLSRLWNLGIDRAALEEIGRTLGADVPFFLHGGTALGEGRGDRVTPLADAGRRSLLVGLPPFGISTTEVYRRYDEKLTLDGLDVSVTRLSAGNPPRENDFRLGTNDLERVVFERWPELENFRDELLRCGAEGALLSGSGSSVFGVFDDPGTLRRAHELLGRRFERWRLLETRTVQAAAHVVAAGEAE